jgi:hypothetical protein
MNTNIFNRLAYNFKSRKLETIRSLAKRFRLKLLVPDPIEREIQKHIADRLESAVKSLENAAHKAPFLTQLDCWPLKNIERTEFIYELQENIKEELLNFLGNFDVIKLDYNGDRYK